MTSYATKSDVYTYALPRGALGNPGRLVESSFAATSTITLSEHGFALGDAITFRIPGAVGDVLSSPLVAGTVYYAVPVTDSSFTLSSTSDGGTPITLTTDGVNMLVQADLPWAALGEFYSRLVDGYMPAEVVPLSAPYPVTVVGVVAGLMAAKAQRLSGVTSESMEKELAEAREQIKRWAATLPVRDAVGAVPANLSIVNARKHENRIGRGFGFGGFGGLDGDDWH